MNNTQRRVLIISPFFYPEPISTGKYNTDLALSLAKQGHKVHVWCFHPFYPDWKISKSDQQLENIFIKRGGLKLYFFGKQLLDRIILETAFFYFVAKQKTKNKKTFDNVIFVSPPSLSIFLLKTFKKAKQKVIIVHDLQFIHLESKIKSLAKIVFWFEKKFLGYATKVIFLSTEMKNYFDFSRNKRDVKTFVQLPFVNIKKNQLDKLLLKQGVNIVYSGALGAKQSPYKLMSLFDYVAKKEPDWNFYVISSGAHFKLIKGKNKKKNIHFMPLVRVEELYQLYNESTIQIIPQAAGSSAGSLPSKLPNLIFSKTKILAITDSNSDLEVMLNKYPNSKVINNWEEKLFYESVRVLVKQKTYDSSKETDEICTDYFSIDSLIDKITQK